MARFVITGTGTDIGKTVFAAGLVGLIGASYWKPVQTGVTPRPAGAPGGPAPGSDAAFVHRMTSARIHPEAVVLPAPLSPHRAAELAGVAMPDLTPPDDDPLVVLTPRERDVLALMAEGRSNQGIADKLVITLRAVEKYVSSIFGKLGLPSGATDSRRVLAVLVYLRA